jgi:DNA-binding MarR family transcriptional regulator
MDTFDPPATSRGLSRHDATDAGTDFTLSLEQAGELYARAGHPRTLRSLQRYCASGHLDARKIATALGDKYLVTPQSVARHIARAVDRATASRSKREHDSARQVATAATEEGEVSRYVGLLEKQLETARDERDFLREQIDRKDKTIDALIERDRETNYLVRGLQEMLSPLLGTGRREPPPHQPAP